MNIKALFSPEGDPLAFYDTDLQPSGSIPSGAVTITENQWMEFLDHQGMRRWIGGQVLPYEPPAPEPVVPAEVTRTQGLLALLALPTPITEAQILAAIDGIEDLIERERARILLANPRWKRADPFIAQIGAAFGLDGAAIDELFKEAVKL